MSRNYCVSAVLAAVLVFVAGTPSRADEGVVPPSVIKDIQKWASSPVVHLTLEASNKRHAALKEAEIIKLDKQWRAERKKDDQPLITAVLSSPLSSYLTKIQARSLGLYSEIFVMDSKGLNAGQSSITSDYWQGDEAKWKKTFPVGPTAVFVDTPETNDKTGTENVQVNLAIADGPRVVGAITVEINLTELKRRQAAGKL